MRYRPRFSVRTLAIVVTLVCAYFAAWEATKSYGFPDREIEQHRRAWMHPFPDDYERYTYNPVYGVVSPMPLVVRYDEPSVSSPSGVTCYYLWLFGPTIKLPFEQ